MLERQFADFVFSQLDMKVPALRNEHNREQVTEVSTLIEQLKGIVDVSLTERPRPIKKRTKKEDT